MSLPVNVFCCDGWYEQKSRTPSPRSCETPWPNAKRRARGTRPISRSAASERVQRDLAQRQHRAQLGEQPPLALQVLAAVRHLLRQRLVGGRRAARGRRHVAVAQGEAVVARDRGRLVREAGAVQRGEEEVARPVAGEDAAGAVAAVRGRGQAHDQQARPRVAEAGHRLAPVAPGPRSAGP